MPAPRTALPLAARKPPLPDDGTADLDELLAEERSVMASALSSKERVVLDANESTKESTSSATHPEQTREFSYDETLCILDWDDTILPSSWVHENCRRFGVWAPITPQQREVLAELAQRAAETIQAAKQIGTVLVVTNAARGWIELSCLRFLPTLFPLLESVKLLSARTMYESQDLPLPSHWKLAAFSDELHRIFDADRARRKNIVSIGDGIHEREALLMATADLPNCRVKVLKFVEQPAVEELRQQHVLMAKCLGTVVQHDGNLDLTIMSRGGHDTYTTL